jgi:hypothetical protein
MPIEWKIAKGNEGQPTPEECRDYIHGIFSETTYGDDPETGVTDILTDLMHFCKLEKIDSEDHLRIAQNHFKEEVQKDA